jgi:iron complex outermembrane receptor protein
MNAVSRRRAVAASILLAWSLQAAHATLALQASDLGSLSLEDLGNVVVSSVAKNPEALAKAPAAVYLISHDDILRSGARSLPDILRLAPNLEVFQTSPSGYTITARGFSGNNSAQNFPNKLLVLIDGRSVYSPIFSGMYWDDQFVLPENIERIEVISGPGGALWGANAVNGVINIITRAASDTQGGLLSLGAGNLERRAAVQYGGRLGRHAHYRVYASDVRRRAFDDSAGHDAHDGWRKPQAGFRLDWDAGRGDALMLQGDLHDGRQDQPSGVEGRSTEGDLLARWQHALGETSSFQLQAYYDHVNRRNEGDGSGFKLDTWDIEAQYNLALGDRNRMVWGAGDRIYRYDIQPRIGVNDSLLWNPARNTQHLANAFVQDQLMLVERTQLTLGLKAEDDPYAGVSLMPNARLSWQPTRNLLLWAAASRAVRTPTPFDEDVLERQGGIDLLVGNRDFRREKLTAYEAGWRAQVATRATVSVSLYYNVYDDLRTIEFTPVTLLPLTWGNNLRGHTQGVEAWGSYAVSDRWQLGAGFTAQRQYLHFKPGASGLLGVAQVGNDPDHWGFIRSTVNLSDRWTLYTDLRGVDALPDPRVPGYVELDARLGWLVNDKLELALSGFNLLHAWHQEYVFPESNRIGRSVSLDARLHF